MKIKLSFLFLLAMIVWSSCTEKMEIETEEEYVRLVVDGSFSTEKMAHTIRLTSTADYFSGEAAPVVTGAAVTITDGVATHSLPETSPGIYRTRPDVAAVPGRKCRLEITLAAPLGGHSEYTAESAVPVFSPLDSVRLKFHPTYAEAGMWEARGFFRDTPDYDFYRFMAFRNGILVTDTLTEWYVTDDFLFAGRYVNGWTVAFLNQYRKEESLTPGDRLTIRMDRISREYANFIQGAQSEMRGSFPLFTGPPANVKGNISNGAIGFFATYASSRATVIVP